MAEFEERNTWEDDEAPPPRPWWRSQKAVYAGIGVAGLLAFAFIAGTPAHKQPAEKSQQNFIGAVVPYQPAAAAPMPAPAPPAPAPLIPATLPVPPSVQAKPHRQPAMLSYPVKIEEHKEAAAAHEPEKSSLALKAEKLPGGKATPAYDLTYMLMPGLLSCVLDTAVKSDLPGPLLCHLPGPVYSERGVMLMEAGTKIVGQYRSMEQGGGNRLMAVSLAAYTPNGVMVPLTGQPMSDDLGRTGLDGAVDHRYWERYSGALLLDLAHSALGILQSEVAKGGNTYISFNSGDNLTSQILQSTINLPPLFSKNQGEPIGIFLTMPIDFSDSYRVKAAR